MWVHPSQGWSEEGGLMLMASLPALNRAAHRVQRSPDDIDKEVIRRPRMIRST
jgi:hypothetical protein